MTKVVYFNFNVGSAIEYVGNTFNSWLREIEGLDVVEIKEQDQPFTLVNNLIKEKPSLIILNEMYDKSSEPTFYYKKFFPSIKVVLLNHSWKSLLANENDTDNELEKIQLVFNRSFYNETCDFVLNLNYKPDNIEWPIYLKSKVFNAYFPVDSSYEVKVKWIDRKKNFIILGNIYPLKISKEFIQYCNNSGLTIDCYGNKMKIWASDDYFKLFEESTCLVYKGIVPQEDVSDLLNQYKYFVMPHDGYEVFGLSLLQAIKCGTIPLVVNDRTTKKYDYTWIDWANGLYYGCNKPEDLVKNMINLVYENPDMSDISEKIALESKNKFSSEKIEERFKLLINSLVTSITRN